MKEKTRSYLTVGILYFVWLLTFMYIASINILQAVWKDLFNVSAATIGFMVTAYSLTNAVGRLSSGFLPRFLGIKRVLLSSILLFGVTTLFLAFPSDFLIIVLMVCLANYARGLFKPATYGLSMEQFPRRTHFVSAVLETAGSFGMFIGPILIGWLIETGYGWQLGPQILFLFAIIGFVPALFILKEPKAEKKGEAIKEQAAESTLKKRKLPPKGTLKVPTWVLGLLVVAPVEEVGSLFGMLLPLFLLTKFQVSVGTMALIYGSTNWLGLVGQFVAASICERVGKLWTLMILPAIQGLALIGILLSPSIFYVTVFLVLKSIFGAYWVLLPSLIGDVYPLRDRIKILGTMEFVGYLSIATYPPIQGWLMDTMGITVSWILPIGLMFGGVLCNFIAYTWFKKQRAIY